MIKRFFNNLFRLDAEETKGEYLFHRIFETIVIYQVIYYAWTWGVYLPRLGEMILPLGIANYLDVSFMFSPSFAYANALLITLFAVIGYIRKWRYSYLAAVLLMHLHYAARFSQGEISHGSNFTGLALLVFALAFAFFKEDAKRRRVAFGMFLFFVGTGYTSAACSKLIGTGIGWIDGRHLYLWIGERAVDKLSQNGQFDLNFLQQLILSNQTLASLILFFGLASEFLGFLMWFRKTRWVEGTMLIAMHIGVSLSMRIAFNSYLILLIVISYPWHRLLDQLLARWPDSVVNRYLEQKVAATP
ncbi:MAG: hypothetical protein R3211_01865 [Balneolaceae bacterium]|nr:hypothetical protein [Balneolaceae bacterium]